MLDYADLITLKSKQSCRIMSHHADLATKM